MTLGLFRAQSIIYIYIYIFLELLFRFFLKVYRLVTEDTIEEKVVERAQQKLKLDAMVVQRGMLQGEKKLEKDEMLAAIRCDESEWRMLFC